MGRTRQFDPEQALERAVQQFRRHGYAATSVRDLGRAMGIGRASLYETFGNKDDIFAACLQRYRRRSIDSVIAALAASEDPVEGIRTVLTSIATHYATKRDRHGCLLVNTIVERAANDRAIARVARAAWSALEDALTDAVERGQKTGQIDRTRDARALGRFLVNTFQGIGVGKKLGPEPAYLADVVASAMSVLGPSRK